MIFTQKDSTLLYIEMNVMEVSRYFFHRGLEVLPPHLIKWRMDA